MLKKILILFFVIILIAIPSVVFVISDNYFSDRTNIYINQQVKRSTSKIFGEASLLQKDINTDSLVQIVYDNNLKVNSILINSGKVNEIISTTTKEVEKLVSQEIIEKEIQTIGLPLGQLVSKSLFANKGPMIYLETLPITAYTLDIITKTKEFGINNIIMEIYLLVTIDVEILIPLKQNKVTCDHEILIFSQMIEGEVPRYYYKGNGDVLYIPEDTNFNPKD